MPFSVDDHRNLRTLLCAADHRHLGGHCSSGCVQDRRTNAGDRRRGGSQRCRKSNGYQRGDHHHSDPRQPVLLRSGPLRSVHVVLVPAHRHVPAGDTHRDGSCPQGRSERLRQSDRLDRPGHLGLPLAARAIPEHRCRWCSTAIPCDLVWFEKFGFITLPFMAFTAFAAVLAVTTLPRQE